MTGLYLIANAWGPRYGGINAFNTDFAKALGLALGRAIRVACIVLEADDKDAADAAGCQVDLIRIGPSPDHDRFDPSRAHDILEKLGAAKLPVAGAVWIGHDIVTGDVAFRLGESAPGGQVVLIHHMSYIDYQGYKHGVGQTAKEKHDRQRALFAKADRVYGVGPLLRDRLADLLRRDPADVGMIIPGLPEIESQRLPTTFTVSAFGRLDPENDRIKQGRLAVAGFAALCSKAGDPGMPKALARPPQMNLVGISAPGGDEEEGLRQFACKRAGGRAVHLLPLPYDNDRRRVLDDLAGSSVAMMLSWHEGFGLTGWEAIAAEVPLILGRNSGLYELIRDLLAGAGLGCVRAIDIHGNQADPDDPGAENFSEPDAQAVCDALLEVANDQEYAKRNAKRLRTMLEDEGCTWEQRALAFGRDFDIEPPALPPPPAALPVSAAETAGHPAAVQPVELAVRPLLEIPANPLRGDLAPAESALLRADAESVPFHALREPLLAEVLGWAESDTTRTVAMQLRIGEGGSGKTRLMIEACRRLAAAGWCAGFLRSAEAFEALEFAHLLRNHPTVFVVIDYAETRRQTLVALLRAALKAQPGQRVRILLLARAAGDWWDRLPDEHADLEPFLTGRAVSGPYRMPPVALDADGREALFREAQHAFAELLGRTPRTGSPDLSPDYFGQVLFIHLSALADLADQRPETAGGLLDATLRREARYWHQAVADQGLADTAARGLDQAVALVTLVNGARSAARARDLIDRCPALRESDQHTREVSTGSLGPSIRWTAASTHCVRTSWASAWSPANWRGTTPCWTWCWAPRRTPRPGPPP